MIGSAFTGGTEPPSCPVSPLSLLLFPFGLKNSFLSHLSTTVFSDLLSLSSKLIASFLYLQKPLGKRNLSRRPHHQSRTLFFFIPLHFVFGVFLFLHFLVYLDKKAAKLSLDQTAHSCPWVKAWGAFRT